VDSIVAVIAVTGAMVTVTGAMVTVTGAMIAVNVVMGFVHLRRWALDRAFIGSELGELG